MKKQRDLYGDQKRYTERNKAKGNVRVNVWIPEENRDELREIASAMRDGSWELEG